MSKPLEKKIVPIISSGNAEFDNAMKMFAPKKVKPLVKGYDKATIKALKEAVDAMPTSFPTT